MSFAIANLKNGIKVILAPRGSTSAVSVLVLVRVGSRYENSLNNGISHFTEHLMFKGTQKRPSTFDISQELDSIGADYNAFTSKESTGYYIKSEKSNVATCIDILSDMLLNSTFVAGEVQRERGTILEEINMYEDNPMSKIGDFFEEDLFGKSAPLGRHIIGTPKNIRSISRGSIVSFWKNNYHAGNFLISVAGNFDKAKVLKLLEQKFGQVKKFGSNKINQSRQSLYKFKFSAHQKKTSQAHLILGFPCFNFKHPDRYALSILGIILGGNMSSRLFIEVRERLGLCYFIKSGIDLFEDAGTFYIHAGLDLKKVSKALGVISEQLKDLKQNLPNEREFEKAKKYIKGKIALDGEDSLDIASFYGSQLFNRQKILTPQQVYKKIESVKISDIQRVANKIILKKTSHLSVIGPYKNISSFANNLNF